MRALGGGLDAAQLAADARYAAEELRKAVRPAYAGDVAQMTASNGSLLDALLATNAGPGGENCQARSAETCRCHPSSWKPITMPKTIKPQEARERLAKGVRVKNPLGEDVTLNNELLKHWEKAGKREDMINDRLSALPLIEEVVKNPAEIWENNNGSRTYLASVIDPYRQNGKSYTVAFTQEKDNTVLETYHLNSNNAAGKRKGKQLYP